MCKYIKSLILFTLITGFCNSYADVRDSVASHFNGSNEVSSIVDVGRYQIIMTKDSLSNNIEEPILLDTKLGYTWIRVGCNEQESKVGYRGCWREMVTTHGDSPYILNMKVRAMDAMNHAKLMTTDNNK